MTVFYWIAGVVVAAVALPAALYFALYLMTGERACERRSRLFGRWTATLVLATFNIAIFRHVIGGIIDVMR